MPDPTPLKIVFSYSKKDLKHLDKIKTALIPLKRTHNLDFWDRDQILAGEDVEKTIKIKFFNADIIILLITSDYLGFEENDVISIESQIAQTNLKNGY